VIDRPGGPDHFDESLGRQTAVGEDRDFGPPDLADLRLVDVDVHHLRPRRESRDLAGHTIVETAAEGKQQIRLLHGGDGGVVAVHPGHPKAQRVTVRKRAAGHEGGHDGNARQVHQLAQRL
jgi:hypothetical protein